MRSETPAISGVTALPVRLARDVPATLAALALRVGGAAVRKGGAFATVTDAAFAAGVAVGVRSALGLRRRRLILTARGDEGHSEDGEADNE